MRGVISAAGYVPYRRLDRSEIAAFFGSGGGKGARAVASYDEDTTTMGQAAADLALRSTPVEPQALWFATSAPAYLEKTNAAAIHAALRLDPAVGALDFGGAVRSGMGALRTALAGRGPTLVVAADIRDGLPTGADEASAGDGAAAVLVGDDSDAPVLAEYLGGASRTLEVTERWRTPGGTRSRTWEERFGAHVLAPVAADAWQAALVDSGLDQVSDIDRLAVTGLNGRAVASSLKAIGAKSGSLVDPLIDTVGNTATAHPALLLCSALEQARPGETIAVVALADGAEAMILRVTEAIRRLPPGRCGRGPDHRGRGAELRPFPRLAQDGDSRASEPSRPVPTVVVGRATPGRLEVRIRGIPRPVQPDGASAPGTSVGEGRRRRRHGPGAHGPHPGQRRSASPWTGSHTRPARPPCSRWWTSTVAAGPLSSSPT